MKSKRKNLIVVVIIALQVLFLLHILVIEPIIKERDATLINGSVTLRDSNSLGLNYNSSSGNSYDAFSSTVNANSMFAVNSGVERVVDRGANSRWGVSLSEANSRGFGYSVMGRDNIGSRGGYTSTGASYTSTSSNYGRTSTGGDDQLSQQSEVLGLMAISNSTISMPFSEESTSSMTRAIPGGPNEPVSPPTPIGSTLILLGALGVYSLCKMRE